MVVTAGQLKLRDGVAVKIADEARVGGTESKSAEGNTPLALPGGTVTQTKAGEKS